MAYCIFEPDDLPMRLWVLAARIAGDRCVETNSFTKRQVRRIKAEAALTLGIYVKTGRGYYSAIPDPSPRRKNFNQWKPK